jgi:hypothetical protein
MPKIFSFFWARQVHTFPVHDLLVGSLSLDGPSTDKFLKEALVAIGTPGGNLSLKMNKRAQQMVILISRDKKKFYQQNNFFYNLFYL